MQSARKNWVSFVYNMCDGFPSCSNSLKNVRCAQFLIKKSIVTKSNNCGRTFSTSERRRSGEQSDSDEVYSNLRTFNRDLDLEKEIYDQTYANMIKDENVFAEIGKGYRVLLIHPKVKNRRFQRQNTSNELMLAEAKALVETLPSWSVADSLMVNVEKSTKKKWVFGTGKVEELAELIYELQGKRFNAIVINMDMLTGTQHSELFEMWKVPIFDRYNIVLQIFKTYARTAEAKIQIALAEIPYLRARLQPLKDQTSELANQDSSFAAQLDAIGSGSGGESYWQLRRQLLNKREIELKKKLAKIRSYRDTQRESRSREMYSGSQKLKRKLPVVAVLGYTNAGKTSLIKAFTGDQALNPKNRLFATLDVTLHGGRLPNNVPVLFADTVGFISDLPHALVASFGATLDDIRKAHLLVHIRDIAHPDATAQKDTVLETLQELKLPENLVSNMIEVCNKSDLLPEDDLLQQMELNPSAVFISCQDKQGLSELGERLQTAVMSTTDSVLRTFKVSIGGDQWEFLQRNCAIQDSIPLDDGSNNVFVKVVIDDISMKRFEAQFGVFKKRKRKQ